MRACVCSHTIARASGDGCEIGCCPPSPPPTCPRSVMNDSTGTHKFMADPSTLSSNLHPTFVDPQLLHCLVNTHTHTHTHAHTRTHTHTRSHTHTHSYTRTHSYTHTRTHTHTHALNKHCGLEPAAGTDRDTWTAQTLKRHRALLHTRFPLNSLTLV